MAAAANLLGFCYFNSGSGWLASLSEDAHDVVRGWLVAPSGQLSAPASRFEWANLFQDSGEAAHAASVAGMRGLQRCCRINLKSCTQCRSQGSDQEENFINVWYPLCILAIVVTIQEYITVVEVYLFKSIMIIMPAPWPPAHLGWEIEK